MLFIIKLKLAPSDKCNYCCYARCTHTQTHTLAHCLSYGCYYSWFLFSIFYFTIFFSATGNMHNNARTHMQRKERRSGEREQTVTIEHQKRIESCGADELRRRLRCPRLEVAARHDVCCVTRARCSDHVCLCK